MNLEFYIAQCVMIASWQVSQEHAHHFCPYYFMGSIAHQQLYHHYICEPTCTDEPPQMVTVGDDALRWN